MASPVGWARFCAHALIPVRVPTRFGPQLFTHPSALRDNGVTVRPITRRIYGQHSP